MSRLLVGVVTTLALLSATHAAACASCGSGGDSPLVLFPNEHYKAYVGDTHQTNLMTVYPDGRAGEDSGPQQRDTVAAAAGASLSTDWFATVTVPYVTNRYDQQSLSGMGDPLAELRWTVVQPWMMNPDKPQVQLVAGYKGVSGHSIYDSEDEHLLDVFGTGFAEARAGVDVWWGMRKFKYGFAESFKQPLARNIDGEEHVAGRMARSTMTVAYDVARSVKVDAGTTLDYGDRRIVGGEEVPDSETLDHGVFTAFEWQMRESATARLTLTRSAAYGQNKNTTRLTGVTLAVMGAM